MNLLQYDKENYNVTFSPELLLLLPFKKIIERDKSKTRELAKKEIGFIYHFTDIRSDYLDIVNDQEKISEIIHDIGLPKNWKIDEVVQEAINFYRKRSDTVNSILYRSAHKAAIDISNYLNKADELLDERDENGKVVTDISKLTSALEKVPKIMANLNAAHVELIKEQKITEGRSKGSKVFNMFEEGLDFDNE